MNWKLLKELSDEPGAPGYEEKIRTIMIREFKNLTDEISIDPMGNVIAHIPGIGSKLMIDAHMDEVAFIVNYIDKEGFIRVIPLGGIDPKVFYAERLIIWGKRPIVGVVGSIPPHITRDKTESESKSTSIEDCFIDTGLDNKTVLENISIGDIVTFEGDCIETEFSFIGKAFDDRVGLFIMLESAKMAKEINCDLFLVGTVQEERGLRGAYTPAYTIAPQLGISLEGTLSNDLPGVPEHKKLAKQGQGPELRLSDRTFIANRKWINFLSEIATKRNIKYQLIAKRFGGTDATVIQISRRGVINAALSIPVRYLHSAQSIVRKSDIENAVALMSALLEEVYKFNIKTDSFS